MKILIEKVVKIEHLWPGHTCSIILCKVDPFLSPVSLTSANVIAAESCGVTKLRWVPCLWRSIILSIVWKKFFKLVSIFLLSYFLFSRLIFLRKKKFLFSFGLFLQFFISSSFCLLPQVFLFFQFISYEIKLYLVNFRKKFYVQ